MLPIDTVLLIGPLAPIAVVAWGRWRGAEWPTIAARVVLAGAIVMIVGLTILPLAIDPLAWDLHRTRGFPTWIPLLKMREDIAEGLSARQTRQALAFSVPNRFGTSKRESENGIHRQQEQPVADRFSFARGGGRPGEG